MVDCGNILRSSYAKNRRANKTENNVLKLSPLNKQNA